MIDEPIGSDVLGISNFAIQETQSSAQRPAKVATPSRPGLSKLERAPILMICLSLKLHLGGIVKSLAASCHHASISRADLAPTLKGPRLHWVITVETT